VAPLSLEFGALAQGEALVQSFTISNPGDAELMIETVIAENDPSFSLPNLPALPFWIAPGGTQSVDVMYTAEDVGETAQVRIISDAPEGPEAIVTVAGTWAQPAACISPDPAFLADIPPLCDEETTIVVESCGDGALTVDQLLLRTEDDGLELLDKPELPLVLPPGESFAVRLAWAPEEEGPVSGEIVLDSDDPGGFIEVPLSGTATEGLLCDGILLHEIEMPAEYKIADVSFLISVDKTSTHLAPALAGDLGEIAAGITGVLPDTTFGVATFRGYESFGYSMYPFKLEAQQTTDLARVQDALGDVGYGGWDNGYTTTWEAIYQAASGNGYDMGCERSFFAGSDVQPFRASPVDAFNGLVAGTFDLGVPGTGGEGGMGFREGVLPILVVVMHGQIRDPGRGHDTPGGCSFDADMLDAHAALSELGGKFIGIKGPSGTPYPDTIGQLEAFAVITDSYADMDGDLRVEPAVTTWDGDTAEFAKIVTDAVIALAGNASFDVVELRIDDPYNVIVGYSPETYVMVRGGEALDFTLEVEGVVLDAPNADTVEVGIELVADDTIVLSRKLLYVEQ
jgi:hypothetical protein